MCKDNGFCFVDNSNISVIKINYTYFMISFNYCINNYFSVRHTLAHASFTLLKNNGPSRSERKKCIDLQIMYDKILNTLETLLLDT